MLTQRRFTFAHISLALVGLMWVFPFLYYRHQNPLTTFDQEWLSGLLGVLALMLLLSREGAQQIPRIVQLPAALIVLVLLQWSLGLMPYFGQALLYILYLAFAVLLMVLGARLRDHLGLEKLALVLALFLLTGAEVSALIGVLQHFHIHTPLDAVIVRAYSSVYGNLAQPNHFADYIAMGLASLGLLYWQRRLHPAYVVLLATPLLFVMTLSGSRSSWLYLAVMSVLAWRSGQRTLLYYSLSLLAGFMLMHGIVELPFMAGANSIDTLQRFTGANTSGAIRLHLWHESWLMFIQSPWLGNGFGQFAFQHFQMGPVLQSILVTGLYNNAHNLIFQLGAETGLAGLAVLFASLAVWFRGVLKTQMSVPHWWGYAVLGVLGIHSLLEYPLWYVYFLAIAAVLLGVLDETHCRFALGRVGRVTVATILFVSFLSLLHWSIQYQQLKNALAYPPASITALNHNREVLAGLQKDALFSPYADLFRSSYIEVSADQLGAKLALNTAVMRFVPIAPVVYRQSFLLAQNGEAERAQQMFAQALWSYPENAAERQQLVKLADKDPAHFAALLEFANQTEQEYARAIHSK